jgi:hypothetical protein
MKNDKENPLALPDDLLTAIRSFCIRANKLDGSKDRMYYDVFYKYIGERAQAKLDTDGWDLNTLPRKERKRVKAILGRCG